MKPQMPTESGPGKFEGECVFARRAYECVLDGFSDSVTEGDTCYDLVELPDDLLAEIRQCDGWEHTTAVILFTNGAGFVTAEWFDSAEEARAEFERIEAEIAEAEAESCE